MIRGARNTGKIAALQKYGAANPTGVSRHGTDLNVSYCTWMVMIRGSPDSRVLKGWSHLTYVTCCEINRTGMMKPPSSFKFLEYIYYKLKRTRVYSSITDQSCGQSSSILVVEDSINFAI